ncbi:ubiquinol-cytochrome c reductase cytochrome c1 subunit [Sphaerotilus hippei]|uniref:Ubiquinol-cytochrome c reductase cytochrome c1 subunit n=1 Tax=Sphaerotilus hippei TaxID=744406 RepID=A0A318H9A2_9BURK|nr:cytochrome c1 [Sphaerotilus hippei]PXW96667.1 ubiquinol-cytochrome c reductase cytochrome c1 subunit [Sphaerotilus hippei]
MIKRFAHLITSLALGLALISPVAHAAGDTIAWDKFPVEKVKDTAALQNGAKLFVNYCLNCHSAAFMRYNRMRDIGLTEEQIKANLMFATTKVGDTMQAAIDPKQAKDWLGATPPDLTLIARSRAGHQGSGADYLYTYLRTYYRDETKATGWNNLAFPSVGMPHALWELQGVRRAVYAEEKDAHDPAKTVHVFKSFEQVTPGKLSAQEYDNAVADLVAFLQWMGEPAAGLRVQLGVIVLLFLSILTFIAWRLNAAFWKDIK